jgi:hypothetical protein
MSEARRATQSESRLPLWIFLAAVAPLSPVLHYLPVRANVFSMACTLWIFIKYFRLRFDGFVYVVVLATLLISTLPAMYWDGLKLLAVPTYFIAALMLVSRLDDEDLRGFSDFSSTVLLVMLVGCIIGFFYAFLGGEALIEFANPDTRTNGLYLTTLSNAKLLNIIRPSGIFDEPGTLSFVVCMIAAQRHALRMDRRMTWTLLGLGFITFSIAHVIYAVAHLAAELRRSPGRTFRDAALILSVMTVLIVSVPGVYAVASDSLFQRFVLNDGSFQGDNRTELFLGALSQLDWRAFWWGLDADCIINIPACVAKGYLPAGETPLGPLVLYGLFNSWAYYAVEALLLALFFRKGRFVAIGIFLVLLQRPYVLNFGSAILILLTLKIVASTARSEQTPVGLQVLVPAQRPS